MAVREVGNLRTKLSWEDDGATRSLKGFAQDLKGLKSEMNLARSSGKDYTNSLKGLREQSDILTRRFQTQQEKVKELRHRYEESKKAKGEDAEQTKNLSAEYNNATAQMNRTETQLKNINKAIDDQINPFKRLGTQLDSTGKSMQSAGKKMTDFGKSYSMRVTAPIVAGGAAVFKASVDFESAFAGVEKTVDGSAKQIDNLRQGIRDMAKDIPATTEQIAAVAESAGQLGIETEKVEAFTRTMIDLGEATNLTSEQAATEFARFANIVGMSQDDFDKLGSTIVALGNNLATTESEISSMAMRLAGAGAQVGLTESQILAFAGALSSVGIEAEAGGSAFSKVMINMQLAAEQGGKDLENFAKVAGVSAEDFKKAYEKDATGAIISFIDGLSTAEERGLSAIGILDDMGIKEVRLRDTLLRAAGATDVFTKSVKIGSDAWDENTALTEEAEKRYGTTESQLKIMWNRIKDVAISLGDALAPAIMDAIDAAEPLIKKLEDGAQAFADMDEEQQQTILKLIGLTAAIGPASIAFGGFTTMTGSALRGIGNLTKAIGNRGATGNTLNSSIAGLAGTGGSLPILAGGLAAAGLASYGLYKHFSQELIPEVELFGEGVSKTTEESLGSFLELNSEATVLLNELSWTGKTVSEDMKDSMVETFGEMKEQIVSSLQEQKSESLEAVKKLFKETKDISAKEQAEILESVTKSYDERVNQAEESYAKAIEIMNKAYEEGRGITEKEQNEINRLLEEGQNTAIEIMTESEKEQTIILERMREQADTITKRQASEVISNSYEQKNEVIKEAEEQFYQQKLAFENARDVTGELSKEQADKLIEEARRQKDETIASAKEMHQAVIDEAIEKNPELIKEINLATGEIKTAWDKLIDSNLKNFMGLRKDASSTFKDIKHSFTGDSITMKKPLINRWFELQEDASRIWGNIKSIFQRKISVSAPTIREPNYQTKSSNLARFSYATGTDYHPGGSFLAGEEGYELGRLGNRWEMLDYGMYNRPSGYQVFTHDETKNILKALNRIPGYATGARPSGEANRIIDSLNNTSQLTGETVIYTTVINQMDGRELSRHTYKHVTEMQNRDKEVREQFAT